MPRIDDAINIKRNFKKKEYRPWDILGESSEEFSKQIDNNETIIGKQKRNKKETVKKQLANNPLDQKIAKETISEPISKPLDAPDINSKQEYKTTLEGVKGLCGIQRKILFYIVEDCSSRGLLITSYIQNETLRLLTNTDAHSVKTSIQRLIHKGFIQRERGKRGKGGFSCFLITEEVRNSVIEEHRQLSISKQLGNYWDTNKETKSSSSSSEHNNKTTTVFEEKDIFSDEWKNLNIEPLANIGFNFNHLLQIAQQHKLSPEMVKDSIQAFAFDLKKNNKANSIKKGSPLNFFMGILRNGQPYSPPENYESPEDETMRIYLEKKKVIAEKRAIMEQQLLDLAFDEWLSERTEQEIKDLLPESYRNKGSNSAIGHAHLKTYFKDNKWTELRKLITKDF